jgi:hypothetical protein
MGFDCFMRHFMRRAHNFPADATLGNIPLQCRASWRSQCLLCFAKGGSGNHKDPTMKTVTRFLW